MQNKSIFMVFSSNMKIKKKSKLVLETSRHIERKLLTNRLKSTYNEIIENTCIEKKNHKERDQYLEKENIIIFNNYGPETYFISKMRQENQLNNTMLNFNSYNKNFFKVRTKMIDWMIDVIISFRMSFHTLFHTISLMDHFIGKSPERLEISDLHLIGITCIYISSKYEDIKNIRIASICKYLGHNSFKEAEIRSKEINILNTVNWDIIYETSFDFIRTFFFDFFQNNNVNIKKYCLQNSLNKIESSAIYFSLIMLHCEDFVNLKNSTKAIISIFFSLNIFKQYCNNSECISFLRNWVSTLIEENKTEYQIINRFYNEFVEYCFNFQSLSYIKFNVKNTNLLIFD